MTKERLSVEVLSLLVVFLIGGIRGVGTPLEEFNESILQKLSLSPPHLLIGDYYATFSPEYSSYRISLSIPNSSQRTMVRRGVSQEEKITSASSPFL